jgi:hypothetical protein
VATNACGPQVWTAFNFGLYGAIPQGYQPAATALMSAGWNAFLSTVSFQNDQ